MKIKRTLVLLLSLVAINTSAQFNPVVFKPKESDNSELLLKSMENREKQRNEAYEQYNKLQMKLSEYESKLYHNRETLLWYDEYKNRIEQVFNSFMSMDDFDLAKNFALRKQGEIMNDSELTARIRTASEYLEEVRMIQKRTDMSQQEKSDWIVNHPYCFIPITNSNGKIIGGKLGTKEELETYKAEVERKAKLQEEQEKARLYAMAYPFENYDYSNFEKIIDFPQYQFYTKNRFIHSDEIMITKIALSSSETRIEMIWKYTGFNRCYIKRGTYIQTLETKKMNFLRVENNVLEPYEWVFRNRGEVLKFALIFPPLPKNTKFFTLSDADKQGWKFKNIKLK